MSHAVEAALGGRHTVTHLQCPLRMLINFLAANQQELVNRCKAKVSRRTGQALTPPTSELGVPTFISQLIETLRMEKSRGTTSAPIPLPGTIGSTAGQHGTELHRRGFTAEQVVHDYGDLCQALTELAHEKGETITVDEFHTFNRCLDDAMAAAVTEFARTRDQSLAADALQSLNERLGHLAHDLRNPLNIAMLSIAAIKSGRVALTGATAGVLDRSLNTLREVIDLSLADVRLTPGFELHREKIPLDGVLDEIRVATGMQAKDKGLGFTVVADKGLTVDGDRQMISSALENLLQNALRLSRPAGRIALTARGIGGRVVIELAHQRVQAVAGKPEPAAPAFDAGLSISKRCIEANGGTLTERNLAGIGAVFAIDLPATSAVPATA